MLALAFAWGLPADIWQPAQGRLESGFFIGGTVIQNLFATMHDAALFIFGILLASRFEHLMRWLGGLGASWRAAFLVVAVFLLAVPSDIVQGVAASLLILLAAGARVLTRAPLRWAGRVSPKIQTKTMVQRCLGGSPPEP